MPSFGKQSQKKLDECHPDIQRVLNRAIKIIDFSVICGQRSVEDQQIAFREGRSELDGITKKSKHNYVPSKAADILPYPAVINGVNVWDDHMRFHILMGVVMACAHEEGVKLRFGRDRDRDWET